MGQCYSVEVTFTDTNDKAAFGAAIRRGILSAMENESIQFPLDYADIDDPFGAFAILTADDAFDGGTYWSADFDGSYGWETVLTDIIGKALRGMSEGTKALINVDCDADHDFAVVDGIVGHKYGEWEWDEEDEEDEDYEEEEE